MFCINIHNIICIRYILCSSTYLQLKYEYFCMFIISSADGRMYLLLKRQEPLVCDEEETTRFRSQDQSRFIIILPRPWTLNWARHSPQQRKMQLYLVRQRDFQQGTYLATPTYIIISYWENNITIKVNTLELGWTERERTRTTGERGGNVH